LGIAWCIESLACAISLDNQPEQAARLWSLAEAIHDSKGVRKAPIIMELHEKIKANALLELGEARFKKILADDKQPIPLEQAVSEVLAI
jgi:hypothetical protein